MSKEKKKIVEQDDTLHFVLPIKLVPAQDGVSKTPEIKQEAEEEVKEPVAEEADVLDALKESDDEEVKTEAEEDEVKTEAEGDEEVKAESAEEDEVKEESADEEEVKAESEEDKEEVKAESDEEKKDEPVAEEEEKEYKLSEDLGDLKLEQEVKDKIDAAFETIVKEKVARIREELEGDAEKQVKESLGKLQESVSLYCEKAARVFVSQNKLALKESLRLKYFESFFGKLRKLFKENYVDLPEAEEDLAKDLKAENEELKDKMDEALKDNTKLAESVVRLQRTIKVNNVASNMFLTESERFKAASEKLLTEKISDKRFDEKLKAISELFANKSVDPKKKLLSEGKVNKGAPAAESEVIHPDVKAIIGDWSA